LIFILLDSGSRICFAVHRSAQRVLARSRTSVLISSHRLDLLFVTRSELRACVQSTLATFRSIFEPSVVRIRRRHPAQNPFRPVAVFNRTRFRELLFIFLALGLQLVPLESLGRSLLVCRWLLRLFLLRLYSLCAQDLPSVFLVVVWPSLQLDAKCSCDWFLLRFLLQVLSPVLVLSLRIKRLEGSRFKSLSCSDFSNMSIGCLVKCL
jgi:hypothetical protein